MCSHSWDNMDLSCTSSCILKSLALCYLGFGARFARWGSEFWQSLVRPRNTFRRQPHHDDFRYLSVWLSGLLSRLRNTKYVSFFTYFTIYRNAILFSMEIFKFLLKLAYKNILTFLQVIFGNYLRIKMRSWIKSNVKINF